NGTVTTAPHALVLNLQTGLGTNPYGGTLALSNVHNVQVGSVSGVYIVGDNSGDTLNAGHLFGGGNAPVVGGTGHDIISGSSVGTNGVSVINLLMGGLGTNALAGGTPLLSGTATNVFVYQQGVDAISGFRAGTGSGDQIDLSGVPGIASFSDVQARMSQGGGATKTASGGGPPIMLPGGTSGNLTAGNFLFAPVAAFAFTQPGEADTGQTVQIYLAISGAVTVSGGSPTLTLSDGKTATYDAAASSS